MEPLRMCCSSEVAVVAPSACPHVPRSLFSSDKESKESYIMMSDRLSKAPSDQGLEKSLSDVSSSSSSEDLRL